MIREQSETLRIAGQNVGLKGAPALDPFIGSFKDGDHFPVPKAEVIVPGFSKGDIVGTGDFKLLLPRLYPVRQERPEPVHIQSRIICSCKKQPERDARRTAGADGDASGEVDSPACDFVPSCPLKLFFGCYGNIFEIRQTPNVFRFEADVPEKLPIKGDARRGMLNEAPESP